jgi:hypothetical protein
LGWSRRLTKSLACSIIFMGHHLMDNRIVSLYCTMRLALFANRPRKIRAILFATACGFFVVARPGEMWYSMLAAE